jgi:hypothetical protein
MFLAQALQKGETFKWRLESGELVLKRLVQPVTIPGQL